MKLTQNKNTWKKINNIILRVDNISLIFKDNMSLFFDCGFENISRGRCKLIISEKKKHNSNDLFIHTDKALMEVNIYFEKKKLIDFTKFISFKKSSTKKIKIFIETKESLMINNSGDLYISDNTQIIVRSVNWEIPLF